MESIEFQYNLRTFSWSLRSDRGGIVRGRASCTTSTKATYKSIVSTAPVIADIEAKGGLRGLVSYKYGGHHVSI